MPLGNWEIYSPQTFPTFAASFTPNVRPEWVSLIDPDSDTDADPD